MSVQAGIWNFDGRPVDRTLIESYSRRLAKHGPDGESTFFEGSIVMLYRPFHTTSESRLERQPHISPAGNIITWDGRLDNREELAAQLTDRPSIMMTDVEVVAAAFDLWGSECFTKLIGDWALAGWNPKERTLTLAIDYMAIKHLHYYLKGESLTWCTDLEALVLESGDQFDLDDEYIAGYLASHPSPGRTPYLQIRSVEPGHFVRVHARHAVCRTHFKFNPKLRIRYKTDAEYEEHFRHVFRQAVRRRLRSDAPILADLSGGLDSSSIVCMADDILGKEEAEIPRLDTYSHFDLREPNGDDLKYFTIVEKMRGQVGHHLNIAQYADSFSFLPSRGSFVVAPGTASCSAEMELERNAILHRGGYKVRLCGVGGDEVLGGVPDPRQELADLIVQMQLVRFIRQSISWSLVKRTPWIHLALRSIALLLPAAVQARIIKEGNLSAWINKDFARRCRLSICQLGPQARYGFWLPSQQELARTLVLLSRIMANKGKNSPLIEEIRYPFLDQDLIAFLLSVPRNQLLRPGERRSLMRRALVDLVPKEILSRRTKGTAARGPLLSLAKDWPNLETLLDSSVAAHCGFFDQSKFRDSVIAAKNGNVPQVSRVIQSLALELWLTNVVACQLIRLSQVPGGRFLPRNACCEPVRS